eukprot:Filipodium_phascolosomae@DN82_c0_g1_i1.p1
MWHQHSQLLLICPFYQSITRRGYVVRTRWQTKLNDALAHKNRPPPPRIEFKEVVPKPLGVKRIRPIHNTRRTGLLCYKVGMMGLWNEWGVRNTVTVLKADRNIVLSSLTSLDDRYDALNIGVGVRPAHRVSRANLGKYIKLGIEPKHKEKQFKISADCRLPAGHVMSVRHFAPGQWVFVCSWTKAKAFQGPMQRWGFKGARGNKVTVKAHSQHGSVGARGERVVWTGKRMAGHKGPDPRVVNARVFRIESARNLIFLRGSIPGHKGQLVKIFDARGRAHKRNRNLSIWMHFPTFIPQPGKQYGVTLQQKPGKPDPFLFKERPFYDKER